MPASSASTTPPRPPAPDRVLLIIHSALSPSQRQALHGLARDCSRPGLPISLAYEAPAGEAAGGVLSLLVYAGNPRQVVRTLRQRLREELGHAVTLRVVYETR
ncbi:MAG TPA: hypothetical protein VHS99_02890 [Chloroflexota bacterium]|nr:hypothetical protein [Chloroflexota bacterium]